MKMDLIGQYWSQIIVLLTAVGVIIIIFLDWDVKKKEIIFDKVKENKIKELKNFYKCFTEVESHLRRWRYSIEGNKQYQSFPTRSTFIKCSAKLRDYNHSRREGTFLLRTICD